MRRRAKKQQQQQQQPEARAAAAAAAAVGEQHAPVVLAALQETVGGVETPADLWAALAVKSSLRWWHTHHVSSGRAGAVESWHCEHRPWLGRPG